MEWETYAMRSIKMRKNVLSIVLVLFIGGFTGYSQDLVTDRPDFTESAVTVPKGSWQLEFGYTFDKDNVYHLTTHTLGELLVRFTLVEKLEFRVGINSYNILEFGGFPAGGPLYSTVKGFEDMSLGLKWEIIRDNVAVLVSTTIPTGAENLGSSKLQPSVTLALAKDINKTLAIGVNLGAANLRGGDIGIMEFTASTSLGISLTEKLGMFIEYFGFYYSEHDGKDIYYFNTGFTYLVNPTFQLDIRAGKKLNKESSAYFIGVGASFRI